MLKELRQRIQDEHGLTPRIACELECYVTSSLAEEERTFQALVLAVRRMLPGAPVTREKGESQYEYIIEVAGGDPAALAAAIRDMRDMLPQQAPELGIIHDAMPFTDRPGSAMHLNISLHDASGANVFYKKDEEMHPALRHSLGGLLATMAEAMPFFAPHAESYGRYTPRWQHAPTHICWGGNNRTAALRLPDSSSGYRHIEHRAPGADADPQMAIAAILAGLHYGLTHRCDPGPPVYGNAFLPVYDLPPLPASPQEAAAAYDRGGILRGYGHGLG